MARQSPQKQQTKPTDTTEEQGETFDPVAFAVDSFNDSWEYTSGNYHARWEEAWKLYNNQRVKRGYVGITDTFVPMTFSTIETLVAALAGNKPKFDFIPPQGKEDQNTEILNALLDYYWDKDQWNIKVINWVRSVLLYGTGVPFFMWDIDHPRMVNVPLRDFIFDPTAKDIDEARYVGRRYLTCKDELESFEIVDPETGRLTKRYTNLDKISQADASDDEQTDKQQKDMFYGSTVGDDDEEQIEVIEIWTGEKLISVANRKVCIENVENPHLTQEKKTNKNATKGLLPFAPQRNYVDESLFYGKSEVDTFKEQQELLNDLTNQNTDAITFNLNQMYTLDPESADMIEQIENLPGAVYPLKAGQLTPIPMQQIPSNAFNERMNIKNEIRETTASDQVIRGVGGTQTGDQTATEIQAQVAGASQRFGIKVTQLENEGFHRMARIVFSLIRLYVTKPVMVRVVGKDGINWQEFDPNEFSKGDYEPRVQLDATVQANKQTDMNKSKDVFAALIADPDINKKELYKLILPRAFDLDPDEVQALLTPSEDALGAMGAMGGAPLPPLQPVEDNKPKVNISLKGDLTPALVDAIAQKEDLAQEGAPTAMDYATAEKLGTTPDLAHHQMAQPDLSQTTELAPEEAQQLA